MHGAVMLFVLAQIAGAFLVAPPPKTRLGGIKQPYGSQVVVVLRASSDPSEKYSDPITAFLGRLLLPKPLDISSSAADLLINANAPKRRNLRAKKFAGLIERGLGKYEWFVTGRCDASLFTDDFIFTDPSVSLKGLAAYSQGVARLFDQETSRAEMISVTAADEATIVVVWRLEGRVNLPGKPRIKPYIVTTTYCRDGNGLIVSQQDEFDAPALEILLSSYLPGFGRPPAPPASDLRKAAKAAAGR
ncbi:unnamed protein product [Phaeothamnion confervicola]